MYSPRTNVWGSDGQLSGKKDTPSAFRAAVVTSLIVCSDNYHIVLYGTTGHPGRHVYHTGAGITESPESRRASASSALQDRSENACDAAANEL